MRLDWRQLRYAFIAWRVFVSMQQVVVIRLEIVGNIEHHLRRNASRRRHHLHIIQTYHVENHVIIRFVAVVTVAIPVGSLDVHLDVAHPLHSVDLHLSIEEVRSGVRPVVYTHINNLHSASVCGSERGERIQPMLPGIVKKFLHDMGFRFYFVVEIQPYSFGLNDVQR